MEENCGMRREEKARKQTLKMILKVRVDPCLYMSINFM